MIGVREKRHLWTKLLVGMVLLVSGTSIASFASKPAASAAEATSSSSGHIVGDLAAPMVGMTEAPGLNAYSLVGADGGVFSYNGAPFDGSVPGLGVNVSDIVGMASAAEGGYWLVGADGGVFSFGGAPFDGSLPGLGLHVSDIVGMAASISTSGRGYLLVGADGGVFAFGGAAFEGSLPEMGVHVSNIVGIAATPDGRGYYLVGADGGVFAFGSAVFDGSIPGSDIHSARIVGMAASGNGGYWLVGADGGVFSFSAAGDAGSAPFLGSIPALGVKVTDIVGMAGTGNDEGYWLVGADGAVFSFGTATTLSNGYWYGNITSANVADQNLLFVPQCEAASSSFVSPVPFASGSATVSVAPDASLSIYYRPDGDVTQGHGQSGDLQDVAGAVSEGLPDFPPGWYVTIQNGVATNVEESSGIGPSPCPEG